MLAWDRTALGLIGNGALLMVREARPVLAGAALLVALVCVVLGRVRARTAVAVMLLGGLVVALGLAVLATIVLG